MKTRLIGSLVALAVVLVLLALSAAHYENYHKQAVATETAQAAQQAIIKQVDTQNLTNAQNATTTQTAKLTAVCTYVRSITAYSTIKNPISLPADCQ